MKNHSVLFCAILVFALCTYAAAPIPRWWETLENQELYEESKRPMTHCEGGYKYPIEYGVVAFWVVVFCGIPVFCVYGLIKEGKHHDS